MRRFGTLLQLSGWALCWVLLFSGCKRKSQQAAGSPEAAGTPVASAAADPAAVAAPLPPPNAELTVAVERRFIPVQPVNAYSPAGSGDYQAQLNLYNRVLKKWTVTAGWTPSTLQEIMASFGTPKPPQPPGGRTLVYDKKTITVSLQ